MWGSWSRRDWLQIVMAATKSDCQLWEDSGEGDEAVEMGRGFQSDTVWGADGVE